MSEKIEHPSFANLYIGRSQCSGKVALFGSSIKHHDIITLRISPAYLDRDLNYDRYYADNKPYIEINMSQSQFAQAITSMNMGAGVPVTLRAFNGEYIEQCPFVDKREQFSNEFRNEMNDLANKISETTKAVEDLINNKRTLSKADKENILSTLQKVSIQLSSNYPYMYSMFNEQMDKTVSEAKAEIESHLQARMEEVAIRAMGMSEEPDELTDNNHYIDENFDEDADVNYDKDYDEDYDVELDEDIDEEEGFDLSM